MGKLKGTQPNNVFCVNEVMEIKLGFGGLGYFIVNERELT